jgi:putative Holliday junction resolvase
MTDERPPAESPAAPATVAGQIPAGRVAGVDYGRRRIGVAVCDAHRILASPLCVRLTAGDAAADAEFFRRLVADERLVGFVVGLPVHADGTDSRMSVEVERFGGWLRGVTGLPVVFHDERYSSREAAGLLAGSGLSRGRRKERSDAIAAQVVLSSWMEAQARGDGPRRPEALDG